MACNKVDQKIRNLERSYKDFVQYVKKTGEGKKSPPEFYEELSALYGQKHTIHPVALVDSLLDTSTENAGILSPRPSTSKSDTEDTCTSPIEEITKPQKKKIKRTHAKKNVNGDIVSLAHLWCAYAIPQALSVVCRPLSVVCVVSSNLSTADMKEII